MTKLQKAILAFLAVLACFLIGLVTWIWQGGWQQPLGPALQISSVTPFQLPATWTPNPDESATAPAMPNPVSAVQASPTLANTLPPIGRCGAPPLMNIMVVGSDARANSYTYGLADMIRIVRVDFVNAKVAVLEFPRDLWVEIPDIADNLKGQDHEKLNQAYLYGNRGFGYTDDPAQGPGLLARTMTLNFGMQIDHYAAANMRTFAKIVNAVGGIDITLPEAVDGRTATDMNSRLLFRAGTHHLNGDQALMLARIRIEGTFARADNQNRVLCALREKMTAPSTITKIPELITSFQDAVQTDLSPAQLGQLACIGTQIQPGNIIFASFPEEHFKQSRMYDPVFKKSVFVWDVDFALLREYVRQFSDGIWPPPSGTPEDKKEIPFCP